MDHNLDSLHNRGKAVQLVHSVVLEVVRKEDVAKHHNGVVGVHHGVYHGERYGEVGRHNDVVEELHIPNGVAVHRVDEEHHNVARMGKVVRA